jgi:4-alpha-glucanotransferase
MKIKFNIQYNTEFGQELVVCGNIKPLGDSSWSAAAAMKYGDGGRWTLEITLPANIKSFTYQYAVRYPDGRIAQEWGYERTFSVDIAAKDKRTDIVEICDSWKGGDDIPVFSRSAGVAIPVFSLRSSESFGTGEFYDLKAFIDWASSCGMKMVQTLPVNDTMSDGSWDDSYPYGAISVFALHPMYLHLDELIDTLPASVKHSVQRQYDSERERFNSLGYVDYPPMIAAKWNILREIYAAAGSKTLASAAFKKWFSDNASWLESYCAYCYLRDTTGKADPSQWGKFSIYNAKEVAALPSKDVNLYAFVQYHLHLQLSSVSAYARSKGVLLKGDIPIGVSRKSCDAWVAPSLYNMDCQAGAPPDAFSAIGQNWGFPTYNWERMGKDGYAWWVLRLRKMAEYFDAFRIDHILGFFRIWEIPAHSIHGLLGRFSPALPLSVEELRYRGAWFDCDRLCKPYVTDYILRDIFGDRAGEVQDIFFESHPSGRLQFKEKYDTQKKIADAFDSATAASPTEKIYHLHNTTGEIKEKLLMLINEVVLLEDSRQAGHYHPRIALHYTRSYNELDGAQRSALDAIYNDFFYRRHNEFWKESAFMKLPAIRFATRMFVCGEDLGMVPSSVPQAMNALHILSLVIQRMPSDSSVEFANLPYAPYESVCSPGSHDMNGIRSWWEEDRGVTSRYYYDIMHCGGEVPYYCEDWVAENIIRQHLTSPSMWAVFPLQDLLAMSSSLRLEDPRSERINDPANPKNHWKYRMHLTVAELTAAADFNEKLLGLIREAGR